MGIILKQADKGGIMRHRIEDLGRLYVHLYQLLEHPLFYREDREELSKDNLLELVEEVFWRIQEIRDIAEGRDALNAENPL